MDAQFWQNRWSTGKIAFHEGTPNRHLITHLDTLSLLPGSHVFVPLCGKAVDLDWLMGRGYRVTGIELNRDAVYEVFDRVKRQPVITEVRELTRLAAPGLTLWIGDLFELQPDDLGPVDTVYDRAALVALPPALRADYARHLQRLCTAGSVSV